MNANGPKLGKRRIQLFVLGHIDTRAVPAPRQQDSLDVLSHSERVFKRRPTLSGKFDRPVSRGPQQVGSQGANRESAGFASQGVQSATFI